MNTLSRVVGVLTLILVLVLTTALLYRATQQSQRPGELSYDFDILPSSDLILFNVPDATRQRDSLVIGKLSSGEIQKSVEVEGNITEICILSEEFAVLSVRTKPNQPDSGIILYRFNIRNGQLRSFLDQRAESWQVHLLRLSSQQFLFEQFRVRTQWQVPFGRETYGLSEGYYIGDIVQMKTSPSKLDVGMYHVAAVIAPNQIILSLGDKYLLAHLRPAINQAEPKILRRLRLPFTGDSLLERNHLAVSRDSRFFYYTRKNTIYRWDKLSNQETKVISLDKPIIRLRCDEKQVFFLTNSDSATLWRVNSDGTGLEKIFHDAKDVAPQ
ncbi:MAG: hypothetical protein KatS3mg019_0040 [Fimbriimonadales bacterium]|nr:MAG: hypothetical protein KatS3mg019_0040 [Fimbriimonadales bacterium]